MGYYSYALYTKPNCYDLLTCAELVVLYKHKYSSRLSPDILHTNCTIPIANTILVSKCIFINV